MRIRLDCMLAAQDVFDRVAGRASVWYVPELQHMSFFTVAGKEIAK